MIENKQRTTNYELYFLGRIGGAKSLYKSGMALSLLWLFNGTITTLFVRFWLIPFSLFIMSILCLIIEGFIRCISSGSSGSFSTSSDFTLRSSFSSFSTDAGRLRVVCVESRDGGGGGGIRDTGERGRGLEGMGGGGQEARLTAEGCVCVMGVGREAE